MEQLKRAWLRTPKPIRKLGVFIVGWIVVIAGIIMLVIPGPGWAAIFVGFAILATEFTSAKKVHDWLVAKLKIIIDWLKKLWDRVRGKHRR